MSIETKPKKKAVGRPVKKNRSKWSEEWREADSGKYAKRKDPIDEKRVESYLIENYHEERLKDMSTATGLTQRQVSSRLKKLFDKGVLERKGKGHKTDSSVYRKEIKEWRSSLDEDENKPLKDIDVKIRKLQKKYKELDKKRVDIAGFKSVTKYGLSKDAKKKEAKEKKRRQKLSHLLPAIEKEQVSIIEEIDVLRKQFSFLLKELDAPMLKTKIKERNASRYNRQAVNEDFLVKNNDRFNFKIEDIVDNPKPYLNAASVISPDIPDGDYIVLDFDDKVSGKARIIIGRINDKGNVSYIQKATIDDYLRNDIKKLIPIPYDLSEYKTYLHVDVIVSEGWRQSVSRYNTKLKKISGRKIK